ncbi:MAG TPA: hypothetical protein VGR43_09550 [Dehalococcoidia bacterium]|jgi:hypothetical protein|nr:hypothetical protein [Dehalococcoidia bacterium]
MVGELEGWPIDKLSESLTPYEGGEVIVTYDGFRAEVHLDSFTYPDENESGFGSWLAHVRRVLEDVPGNPYHEDTLLDISLEDPPLRVTAPDGTLIWKSTSANNEAD